MRKFYQKKIDIDKIKKQSNYRKGDWTSEFSNKKENNYTNKTIYNQETQNNFQMVMHHGKQKLFFGLSLYVTLFIILMIMAIRDILYTEKADFYQTYHQITQDFDKINLSFNTIQSDMNIIKRSDKKDELSLNIKQNIDDLQNIYPFIDAYYLVEKNTTPFLDVDENENENKNKQKIIIHDYKIYNSNINDTTYNLYSKIISSEVKNILKKHSIKNASFYYFNLLQQKSAYYIIPINNNEFLFIRINQKYFSEFYNKDNLIVYFKNQELENAQPNNNFLFTKINNIDYFFYENIGYSYIKIFLIYFTIFIILNLVTILGYRALCHYYIAMTKIGLLNNELKIISKNKTGNETKMQHLIESTNLVAWTADPQNHTFTYIGQQIVDLTGISYETWLTSGFLLSHIYENDHDILYKAINELKHKSYVSAEYRIYDNYGQVMWLRNIISKSSYNNPDTQTETNILQGFIMDITEQKKIFETLENARLTAEKTSQMKSNFLASMSHELRTPLNSIIGFAEIINSMKQTNNTITEYSENILLSGRHLLDLINDILDYSKIEAGEFEIRIEPTPIADIFRACQKLLQNRADSMNISLLVKVPDDMLLINADPIRLKQILINLLTNALKFNRPNGKIALVYEITEAKELILKVTDTGIGMKSEDLKVALEKFRQVDGSKNRHQEGTGLGLSISKSLTELHGGNLTIKSIYGKGTQVILTFPPSIIYVHNQKRNSA